MRLDPLERDGVTVGDLYVCGIYASLIVYICAVGLVGVSLAVGDGASDALPASLIYGLFGLIPALGVAFLVVAPLGCAVGLGFMALMGWRWWIGALTGAISMATLMALVTLIVGGVREAPDAGTIVFLSGLIASATFAGWLAQRHIMGLRESG